MRRRWPALAATIPLVLVWAVAAAHPASAAPPGVRPGGPVNSLSTPRQNTIVTSSNWAGYVATGASGTFTSASANWTEPAGRCTGRGGKYAAFWVGIDGYTSPTVEQIGTEVDCSGFYPRYYAWYEVYPGAAVNFPNPVSPGDQFSGSVTYQSPSTFNLVLKDTTKGWTQTVGVTLAGAARSSAEVIAEAPCCISNGGILPLTNFGTASFASAAANGQSLAAFQPTEIVMPDTSVSAISSPGDFTVSYTGFPGFPGFPWSGPGRSAAD
jgi:peptidase A4-like protein